MNILFISAILPYPLYSGGQVRIYNLLKQLSKEHTITLFSFIRSNEEKKYVKELSFLKETRVFLRGKVWQVPYVLRALTSPLPLLMASYENRQMKQALVEEMKNNQYNLIHIEPFYVFPVLPSDCTLPLVVAEHNIEYEVYRSYVDQFRIPCMRPLLGVDVNKIRFQEEHVWQKAAKIIAVSDHDMSVIQKTSKKDIVSFVPNGVDTKEFRVSKKSFTDHTKRILFVGNFLWMPNVKAMETLIDDIWPVVKKVMPDATLTVVGKHLPSHLEKKVKIMGATYDPFVDDIREIYAASDVLLAPMTIAGGTKFKILEAMASGCIVITTKEGIEGIDANPDIHYYRVETPVDVVTALQHVYGNPKKSQQMAQTARKFIETQYDWNAIAKKQSLVWKEAV